VPCSGNTTTDEAIIDTNPGTSWSDQVFNGDLSVPTIIALLEIPKIDQKDLKQLEIELGF
jgi:hypothetical protein